MNSHRLLEAAAILTMSVVAGVAGCAANNQVPEACTMIGCSPSLTVEIKGDRGGDISVKIVAADGASRSFECDADASTCTATFEDYTPENISVTVTKREGNAIRSFAPLYHNERPNGENCPPVCRQAHVEMTI